MPIGEAARNTLELVGFEVVIVKLATNKPVVLLSLVEQGPQNDLVNSANMGCPKEERKALFATSAQSAL